MSNYYSYQYISLSDGYVVVYFNRANIPIQCYRLDLSRNIIGGALPSEETRRVNLTYRLTIPLTSHNGVQETYRISKKNGTWFRIF